MVLQGVVVNGIGGCGSLDYRYVQLLSKSHVVVILLQGVTHLVVCGCYA